mmetsp:Transcript_71409/g.189966  ORF Transcript_71409/g.189966 Transcript_71409/m.189966 type:complete len:206 (-) Transcript_71409:776-1393(-)
MLTCPHGCNSSMPLPPALAGQPRHTRSQNTQANPHPPKWVRRGPGRCMYMAAAHRGSTAAAWRAETPAPMLPHPLSLSLSLSFSLSLPPPIPVARQPNSGRRDRSARGAAHSCSLSSCFFAASSSDFALSCADRSDVAMLFVSESIALPGAETAASTDLVTVRSMLALALPGAALTFATVLSTLAIVLRFCSRMASSALSAATSV